MRIATFRHKGIERFYREGDARGVPAQYAEKLRAMLIAIQEAERLSDVERFSGWRLHPLKGDRRGTWSMSLTRNQRLTFKIRAGGIEDVDIEDYH
ncbi:MAG: type II toxin-antitoxin system RelE/ParE family toxin [Bradyrhizobiaceae bacterium]|nr:type II toxin-antitoxin system RelE/ParE family toxin [Bradyrhizobiaceae bacterium]